MNSQEHLTSIRYARRAVSKTLLAALRVMPTVYTEKELADRWIQNIRSDTSLVSFGWYQPPPHGMSVLIAHPPTYDRLKYNSLREQANWPSADVRSARDYVLYPYFSGVHQKTGMIGDFVATFYPGSSHEITEWYRLAYQMTLRIIKYAAVGQKFSDIFQFADAQMRSLGTKNNTFSQSGGRGADIGHTVPYFGEEVPWSPVNQDVVEAGSDLPQTLSSKRMFINQRNIATVTENCAFTIEPQMLLPGLPMASFHMIVGFSNGEKSVIGEFDELFDYFGMSRWIL